MTLGPHAARRPARPAARHRRVHRARHRDERARARALRADRGRRGAGRRRRAARPLELAGRRRRAARPRHPALHRHHAGDGRRGAAARGRAPAAGQAAAGAACSSPTTPPFDTRVLQAGVRARGARLARPAGAVHGRARAPLRPAAAPPRARLAGRRARDRRRARRTARCPTRRRARACCARCCRAWRAAAFTIGDALAAVRPKHGAGRRRRAPGAKRPRDERPDLSKLPNDPGVYIFRDADGHPLYVGKSVCLRTRARAHFTTPVAWTGPGRARRLPADGVRARRAAAREPADQAAAAARQREPQEARRRLRLPALPAGHPVPDPRGRARAGRRPRRLRRPGARAGRGGRAGRADQLAVRAAPLRARDAAAASGRPPTGRWAAACRRAWATWTRTSTASGWRRRCGCSSTTAASALLAHVERADPRGLGRARPTSARRGCSGAGGGSSRCSARLGGALRAAHAGARLVLAPHPSDPARADAFWIVGGRVVDWGPTPGRPRRARGAHARPRCATRRRRAASAAGCRPRSSSRRGSSAPGWPATTRRR